MNKQMFNTPNYSVDFGQSVDRGFGDNKAFPFFYNLISRENDRWIPGSAVDVDLGVAVPSGATRERFIVLDADYPYKMVSLKYGAFFENKGSMEWYNNEAGWFLEPTYEMAIGTPLTRFLDVSVIIKGSDGRYLYGGKNLNVPQNGGADELRLPVCTMQGYDYGFGQQYTPYLLPRNGAIEFRITNNHPTKDLTVTATTFGYKVRV